MAGQRFNIDMLRVKGALVVLFLQRLYCRVGILPEVFDELLRIVEKPLHLLIAQVDQKVLHSY